ncbi:MAG TPA: hypothetical protein VK762_11730 [Polyangiaceae bacterium]|jgi:hypothetical protein|nr:hypothetical protein [Polyangiaceae bacterium]
MDIDFFRQDSTFPGTLAPGGGQYTYVTTKKESNFLSILRVHGFLDEAKTPEAVQSRASTIWALATSSLEPSLAALVYSPSLRLPEGTCLTLTLLPPEVAGWGKATLAGDSIESARKQIKTYLKAGRCGLAHSGGVALLNHILNTPLRDSLKVKVATVADLTKPLTGDLYFRATFLQSASVSVAPSGSGRTVFRDWVDDIELFLSQARQAQATLETHSQIMAEDLRVLDKLRRAIKALFDVGYLAQFRDDDLFTRSRSPFAYKSEIVAFAQYCLDNVLLPSGAGGHFGFAWTLADTEYGKNFARFQTSKIPLYKALAKDFKAAPARHLNLVSRVCDLESDMLGQIAADGDPHKIITPQLTDAFDWYAGNKSGDPPDSAGGIGVLLSMYQATIPQGVPFPVGLVRLAANGLLLHGTLSAPDAATRAARDQRMRGAVARALDLTGDALHRVQQGSGWSYLLSPSGAKKEAAIVVRLAQLGPAVASRFNQLSVALDGKFKDTVAWLRAVGFLASGIGLVDDVLGSHGSADEKYAKIEKDVVSLFGSIVRDYAATHLRLDRTFQLTSPEVKELLTKLEANVVLQRAGATLGVVAGLWTFYNGVQKKDSLLEAGGLVGALGYGLRGLFGKTLILVGFDVTIPLILIGAAFELLSALQPKTPADLVKAQTMNMVNGVVQALRDWYSQRYSSWAVWRASDSPSFESALATLKQMASACESPSQWSWTAFLPSDTDDVDWERARFAAIGFTQDQALALVPTEPAYQYMTRSRSTMLQPPIAPPQWPVLTPTR